MLFIDAKNDLEEKMDKIGSKFRKIDQHLSLVRALKAWAAFRAEEAHAAAEMTRLELTCTLQHMWRFLMRQWFEPWRERAGLFATGQRALMYKGALSYALQSLLLNDTMHWQKVLRRLVGKWRIMSRTQRRLRAKMQRFCGRLNSKSGASILRRWLANIRVCTFAFAHLCMCVCGCNACMHVYVSM